VFENESGNPNANKQATVEGIAPSGQPAKGRGIHFSPTQSGCVNVPDVVMNHSFTIHTWVYCYDGAAKALFGKLHLVTLGFDANRAYTSVIPDLDKVMQMTGHPDPGHWVYLAFSYELDDDQTHAVGYFNNFNTGMLSFDLRYICDKTRGDMWIGCHKNSSKSIISWWHGFMYNFNMCLKVHETSDNQFYNTGCISGCGTHEFD